MKTLYLTNLGNHDIRVGKYQEQGEKQTTRLATGIMDRFMVQNGHLPEGPRNEKLYQAFFQIGLMTRDADAAGFYEGTLPEGRSLIQEDPVGAICVRIDYDPSFVMDEPVKREPFAIFDEAIMALRSPNVEDQYPHHAHIDHIRVAIKVAPDTIIEHTYWATQYDLIDDRV